MIKDSLTLLQNNRKVLEGFVLITGLRLLQMCLGFATTYVLVRSLTVDQYGQYNFVIGALGILSIFSLTEMNNAVMQSISRGFYGAYRKAIRKTLPFSMMGSLVLLLMAPYYWWSERNDQLALALVVAGALFPLSMALVQWKSLCMAENKFKKLTRIEGANSILTNISIIGSCLLFPQNFLIPLALFLAIPAIRNITAALSDLKRIPADSPEEQGSVEYGFKTSLYAGFGLIAANLDRVILFFFLPAAAVGLFSAADRMSDIFKNLTQDLSAAMAPKLAKHAEYSKKLDHVFMFYGLVMGIALIVFSFTLMPSVFLLIFSHKYAEAVPYAQALMCSVAIGNFSILRFRYVRSKLDIGNYRLVTVGTAIFRILSLVILVPFWGIWGAVASAILSRSFTAALINWVIRKSYLKKTEETLLAANTES